MLEGKTESGFTYKIPESRVDNMELLDALAGLDKGNPLEASNAVMMLLGPEQKRALYDHLRTADGTVPIDAVIGVLMEILSGDAKTKNS